jgi:hypothetical protein
MKTTSDERADKSWWLASETLDIKKGEGEGLEKSLQSAQFS